MQIDQFFGTKKENVQKIIERTKATTLKKADQRALEMQHLKPDTIQPYAGIPPIVDDITRLSVMLVFPDDSELDKFKKHFRVAQHGEASVTNIGLLLALVNEIESGRITYEKDTWTIRYSNTKGSN